MQYVQFAEQGRTTIWRRLSAGTRAAAFVTMLLWQMTAMGATQMLELQHDGRVRSCLLHVPESVAGSGQKVPLVMVLHGGRSSAELTKSPRRTIFRYTFDHLADRDGFIVCYPEGIGGNWNDGRELATNEALRENVDDVGFLTKLVDRLLKRYPIDPDRVYTTGFSNGGTMVLRLAEEATGTWAAVAPVGASLPANRYRDYLPRKRLPILVMNGTADPLILWDGGSSKITRIDIGSVIATPELIRFWVRHNAAFATPTRTRIPDRVPDDGCHAVKEVFAAQGAETAPVVLYRIVNGGHTVPNTRVAFRPPRLSAMGNVCMDFEASSVVWEFFKQHRRTGSPAR